MSEFSRQVAELTGADEERLQRLSGGDLSEVLLLRRPDGRCTVAKGGPAVSVEAAMLRAIQSAGIPAPSVEGEHGHILLIEHIENDAVFSAVAWADIGRVVRSLHSNLAATYGWPVDYRLGTIEMDNRQGTNWPSFWAEQRLISAARILDRPWRERVDCLASQISDRLPPHPPAAFLHGDLWSGNLLVSEGRVTALIDPACYHGDAEVDLAMLSLFGSPPDEFWSAYGPVDPGWEERRPIYQMFPALVHLRLFGNTYAAMVDRLLSSVGC